MPNATTALTLLATPQLPTAQLMWYAPERRFIAEASDLRDLRVGRAYADACDEGLTLVGRGGRLVPVVLSHEERDAEGDLRWTDFTPARPADARLFAGLRIFND